MRALLCRGFTVCTYVCPSDQEIGALTNGLAGSEDRRLTNGLAGSEDRSFDQWTSWSAEAVLVTGGFSTKVP